MMRRCAEGVLRGVERCVVEKYCAERQCDEKKFEFLFCQFGKCSYFCTRFRQGKCPKRNQTMPHSSSGPGHLPLTQKIISSTLICGTEKPPNLRGGFFLVMS